MIDSQTQLEENISQKELDQNLLKSKYSFSPDEKRLKRILEIIPGTISWTLVLFPIIFSPINPYLVGYFLLLFDLYWFIKSVRLGVGSIISYQKIKRYEKINWIRRLEIENLDYSHLTHLIMIPEAKEPIGVLRRNLKCIVNQEIDTKKYIIVVIASEKIDTLAEEKFKELYDEFSIYFKDFLQTIHILEIGEIKGKHSNLRHAALEADKYLLSHNYDLDNVTITSSDADSQLPNNYFSQLTYFYLKDEKRKYHFYHAAMIYLANALEIPFPNRVFAAGSSVNNISHLIYPDLIPVSTYTATFSTIKEAGFWSVDVIPEDFHMFFKTFFKFGNEVKTIPIFSLIYSDAAWGPTFFSALKANYVQVLRWAWGVSDDPYIIKNLFSSNISLYTKIKRVYRPLEEHFLWPANWFIITIGTNLPFWLNDSFKGLAFSTGLIQTTQLIISFSSVFIFCMIIIQIKITKSDRKISIVRKILFGLEWLTLPITSFFFSMLPGLEAHTRLMFGKYLSYVVTAKKD